MPKRRAAYRCVATSPGAFVQQLAVQYVAHGYWFYVTGQVPEKKDPFDVDEKLIAKYGIGWSSAERSRRKQAGVSNLQYLRHERFFVLAATKGRHDFFEEEGASIKDMRRASLRCFGYSVGFRGGHASVRIEQEEYKRLKAHFVELACRRQREFFERELYRLPYEPYAPVRGQLLGILRAVNRTRKTAGFEPVPLAALRLKRRLYKPFESPWKAAAA